MKRELGPRKSEQARSVVKRKTNCSGERTGVVHRSETQESCSRVQDRNGNLCEHRGDNGGFLQRASFLLSPAVTRETPWMRSEFIDNAPPQTAHLTKREKYSLEEGGGLVQPLL